MKSSIPANIYPGARLSLAYFGKATVMKIVVHSPEKQIVCNVMTEDGELLYLSPAYASARVETVAV